MNPRWQRLVARIFPPWFRLQKLIRTCQWSLSRQPSMDAVEKVRDVASRPGGRLENRLKEWPLREISSVLFYWVIYHEYSWCDVVRLSHRPQHACSRRLQ